MRFLIFYLIDYDIITTHHMKSLKKMLPVLVLAPWLLCVASVWAENRGGEEEVLRATLENGLTVMILEDRRFPTVTVSLNISGAGGLYEPADSPGLAVMTASLLREGTGSRSSKQLAEDIERLWFELQREMTESGKVVRFKAEVVTAQGEQIEKEIAYLTQALTAERLPESVWVQ